MIICVLLLGIFSFRISIILVFVKFICGWFNWINMDNFFVMKFEKFFVGDIEFMVVIREKICGYDIMIRIECRIVDGYILSDRINEILFCDRIRGLRCKNVF